MLGADRAPKSEAPEDDARPTIHDITRPDGHLIWVLADNGAAAGPAPVIGEELSALVEDDVHVLVTAAEANSLPKAVARHVLLEPIPRGNVEEIRAFLDHWKPDFGVVIGTPDTPLILQTAAKHGLPLFHVMASRNSGGVRRYPDYLKDFRTCLASSAAEANALRQQFHGLDVEVTGPLSDTVRALVCNDAEVDQLAKLLGGRPVWLAADIEYDEVGMIQAAHRKAFRSAHRLLLILVPRDSGSAVGIAEALEADGWQVGLRSRGDEPDPDVQIYVADTKDQLGLWFRLAPSTFVGGTFMPNGVATDPFDPAALGSAVLHGPHLGRTPARFKLLDDQGASVLVRNAEELGEAVIALLAPDKAAMLAQAGWAATTESAPVVERLAELMQLALEAREETV